MTYENLMGWIEDNYDIDDYDSYNDWLTDVRDNFIFEEHVLPKQAEILMQEKWEDVKGQEAISEREGEQEGQPIRVEQLGKGEERVYDTRDIKVASNQQGDAIVTVNANESPEQIQRRLAEPIQSQEIRKQSIASRIKSAIVNAFLFRRR